jgi:hypothetical protein
MVDCNRTYCTTDGSGGGKGQRQALGGDGSNGTWIWHCRTPTIGLLMY